VLGLLLGAMARAGSPSARLPTKIICEGQYPHHRQGIAGNGVNALFWSFTDVLVKTDLAGKVLAWVDVPTHLGDLCLVGDRLHVAWSKRLNAPGADSRVDTYDAADRELAKIVPGPEVASGAGDSMPPETGR
jgi:hypothetical protein